ncbi:hypothetical protein [Microbacterium sp. XT11]|uniref:hypothetical protein n=1 Tax=Microbacterium sp. XT11 TaxID=367477 RepID=UPI000742FDFA|nr:hypothetical protein [Microbacterium sp. XT11]ALX67228.1 hypothetical protein AB663_003012 [Microbacterium sp. XT11]
MSDPHPFVDDAVLGRLSRATSELADVTALTHDWYAGTVPTDVGDVEIMIDATTPEGVTPLLPRLREAVARIADLHLTATDAVVSTFSTAEPEPADLEAAASDLSLDAIEAAADGSIVLHFTDACGEHFPEGYWPAVHPGVGDDVERVTVES